MTIQQFYRVNGDSTQGRGVVSDIVLPSFTEHLGSVEKDQDYALPFDRVQPADHENLGQVSPELKAILKERSAGRIKESKDFTKLAKEIEQFKTWKARKKVPLNEKELREQFTKNAAEKLDQKANELDPEPPSTETAYKFKRNFTNNEILRIMEDLIQGEKLVSKR